MQTDRPWRVIVGLGQTGLSCVRYLLRQQLPCVVVDNRLDPPGLAELQRDYPQVPVYLGDWHPHYLLRATEIVVSPGVDLRHAAFVAARQAGIPIVGDIELFMRAVTAPVIGITGSNGKGTVTTCLAAMLAAAGRRVLVGGNIGIPVLTLLEQASPDYYVLELSSFQLETVPSLALALGVILNISPDHLDRYASMQDYIAAKQVIYSHSARWVINRDDVLAQPTATPQRETVRFGLGEPNSGEWGIRWQAQHAYLAYGTMAVLPVSALQIAGQHNWANALAALALGQALALPVSVMLQALCAFAGLPHRCQRIAECAGVVWYNDSKATNVGAASAALTGVGAHIAGKVILLAGGQSKQADLRILQDPVQRFVRHLVLFGQDAALLAEALQEHAPFSYARDLTEAIQLAKQHAQAGDAVLLAPACASLDMFANYEQRGELFQKLVHELILCQ